jgi:WD40 repeat protein
MGLHSSSQLRLRGSRSFLGSQSSLASLSRRNLASESSRFPKPEAQILDENGEDVTPQPLLGPELLKKISNNTFWNEPMSSESIFHQRSGASGGSFSQPFSLSVMEGGSTMESSLSMSLSSLEQRAEESQITEEKGVSEVGEVGEKESGEEVVVITLTETETISLLDIPCSVVADPDQQESVQKSNLLYQELLKNRQGNDRYSERGMQTIDNARKTKHVQTDPVQTTSSGAFASSADMYDTYSAIEAAEKVKEPHSDASLEELTSRAASRMATGSLQSSRPTTAPPDTSTSTSTAIPGESTFVASVFTQSGSVANRPSGRGLPNQTNMIDPTQPNDHPILKAAGLPDRLRLVETAVMMNYMQNRLALYRNLPTLIEHVPSAVESLTISRGHLGRLWVYSCPLTRGRPVTAICWNISNPDILAVGYDSSSRGEPGQGLVCCWSLKNCEFPARVFNAPSGVTSLSFSLLHPNLLAAGLCNGSVLLYDVRSTQHSPVLDSRDAVHRHCGPVWQVKWVLREKTLGEEARSEALVSTCTDGRVLQVSNRFFLHPSSTNPVPISLLPPQLVVN